MKTDLETKAPIVTAEVRALLNEINEAVPAKTVAERRAAFAKLCSFSGGEVACTWREEKFVARDGAVIRARRYGSGEPKLLYFHGGGYVAGDLQTHHAALTQLSREWTGEIIAVDYRRGPEFKFPTALYDAEDALRWLGSANVFAGGDSAGGNLAAALALKSRLAGVILIYPTLDATFSSASWREIPKGFVANEEDSREFNRLYARSESDFADPVFSPALAKVSGEYPQTSFIVGEADPTKGDCELFADHLRAVGVEVHLETFPGMVHGFFTMGGRLPETQALMRSIAASAR